MHLAPVSILHRFQVRQSYLQPVNQVFLPTLINLNVNLLFLRIVLTPINKQTNGKIFFLIDGSTTGITNTVYNKAGLADVYTIDGAKRLSKASTDEINALPKGVYIVNGKKIIIK